MSVIQKFRVSGTFSYDEFCDQCEECQGHATLKSTTMYGTGQTRKEAEFEVIEALRLNFPNAIWEDQPMSLFIGIVNQGRDLSNYWSLSEDEKREKREQAGKRK